ncbi:MAG TPA: glycosyltransferase family 2 protein [Beijerinckiaceae bacterium]
MNSAPTVTVVIPLYNAARWISLSLACALRQTFDDFEVVVVDDGSTDDGGRIAAGFADPRVRVIRQENRGLAGARNTGVRNARGRYVALLDADDLWTPDKLARHVAHLDAEPTVGVSFSWSAMIDEAGRALGMAQRPRPGAVDAAHVFCRNPVGNGSAAVIRRAALDDIVFRDPGHGEACWFDETFRQSEDIECWTRMAATTRWRFACVPAPLTLYRVNRDGLSANVEAQFATWTRFRQAVACYAPDLEARCGGLAQAYQLRYLARRAVHGGDFATARRLVAAGLRSDPRILIQEPARTLVTIAAAVLLGAVPARLRETVQRRGAALAARLPALRA